MLVSQKITAIRKDKGMSMTELAAASGIAQTSISRYESGKIKKIEEDKLVKIANALGVSYDELIKGDPLYEKQGTRGPYSHRKDHAAVQDEMDEALLLSFHNMPGETKEIVLQLCRVLETTRA